MGKVSMSTRNEIIETQKAKYRLASKKEKTQILNSTCETTGLTRDHVARRLKDTSVKKVKKQKQKRGKKKYYGDECIEPLKYFWELMSYPCSKALAAGICQVIDAIERHHSRIFEPDILKKLRTMSASTIDRLLYSVKRKYSIKGRSTTKPGTLLRANIPVRLGTQWDENMPGFFEIDLVAHCGASVAGEYLNTLDVTDIFTGWTETMAVINKAQKHVFEALTRIRELIPFELRGIDSDNGSEFINDQLYRYCLAEKIVFTRTRPYHKNDNCHVEQKNWSLVRKHIGYCRYEGLAAVNLMNAYYARLRLFSNFFFPQTKLISKHNEGSKIYKKYDIYLTPYQKIINSDFILQNKKDELEKQFLSLDPILLNEEMRTIIMELEKLNIRT